MPCRELLTARGRTSLALYHTFCSTALSVMLIINSRSVEKVETYPLFCRAKMSRPAPAYASAAPRACKSPVRLCVQHYLISLAFLAFFAICSLRWYLGIAQQNIASLSWNVLVACRSTCLVQASSRRHFHAHSVRMRGRDQSHFNHSMSAFHEGLASLTKGKKEDKRNRESKKTYVEQCLSAWSTTLLFGRRY